MLEALQQIIEHGHISLFENYNKNCNISNVLFYFILLRSNSQICT